MKKNGVYTGRVIITDANKGSRDWKTDVTRAAMAKYANLPLLDEPLKLTVEFVMPRPKCHYRTGKNSDMLRPDAPHFHTSAPDTTKLLRGIEDALNKVVWRDDSLVCVQTATKIYGPKPGATVLIERAVRASVVMENGSGTVSMGEANLL